MKTMTHKKLQIDYRTAKEKLYKQLPNPQNNGKSADKS